VKAALTALPITGTSVNTTTMTSAMRCRDG
jgi:hypothetical protein